MNVVAFNQALLDFIQNPPTPFHAVKNMVYELSRAGFKALPENQKCNLKVDERYYITRNDSSSIAFALYRVLRHFYCQQSLYIHH